MYNRHRFVVHSFFVSESEDVDIYVAEPLYQWEQSEKGRWVMEKCVPKSARWNKFLNPNSYSYIVQVSAEFEGPTVTEYLLRWGE